MKKKTKKVKKSRSLLKKKIHGSIRKIKRKAKLYK